jgi:hypothetical protein
MAALQIGGSSGAVQARRGNTTLTGNLIGCVALLAVSCAGAQPAASSIPDLEGIFAGRRCVTAESDVCPEMTKAAAERLLTERAMAFADAFDELAAPKYDCGPATLPGLFGDPYAFEVEQLVDRVVLTYEKDDVVRTIWLEGHGHPPPRAGEFFTHGYSTGRYEGDTLIVETARFAFDPAGVAGDFLSAPSSTQKRIVERYSRSGEGLRMSLTVEDPIFLRGPIEYVIEWRPAGRELSLPWNCDPAAARRNLRLVPTKYPNDPPVNRRD